MSRPFAAGERTCLGAPLARLILRTVAGEFGAGSLTRVGTPPGLRAGITLVADGPLVVHHDVRAARSSTAASQRSVEAVR